MKTTVYIDGFNLYYGALRGTPYKWLDIVKLFTLISTDQNPSTNIISIKFFTAPIKAKVATRGDLAFQSQNDYHRALNASYPDLISIIEGYFSLEKAFLPAYKKPIDKTKKHPVWKLEEKLTDVNIALNIYDDVVRDKCEQVILVSNDSDLLPPLQFAKKFNPNIVIGTVIPRLKPTEGNRRSSNAKLSGFSDWTREYINEDELEKSQLPDIVPARKKAVFKPKYW